MPPAAGAALARPPMRWHEGLHLRLLILQALLMTGVIGATLTVVFTIERRMLLEQGFDLAEELGVRMVTALEERISLAESLATALANLGEALPPAEEAYRATVPHVLDHDAAEGFIAGGGIWPEPGAFDPDRDRRSFFWGRDDTGTLRYYDDYNDPEGPGYHHEEWYVPALRLGEGRRFWSKSYMDPYSYQPMVTCTVPMHRDGEVIGVATVDVKLEGLEEFFRTSAEVIGGYIFAVDRNNKFLSFPRPQLAKSRVPDGKGGVSEEFLYVRELARTHPAYAPIADHLAWMNEDLIARVRPLPAYSEDLVRALDRDSYQISRDEARVIAATLVDPLAVGAHPMTVTAAPALRRIFVEGDPLLGEQVMVSIFNVPRTYWKVGVVVPTSRFRDEANLATRRVASYIVSIELLAFGVMFVVIRRWVVSPIRTMANDVRALAEVPDPTAPGSLDETGRDELGLLAHEFNRRSDQLQDATRESRQRFEERRSAEAALRASEENLRITLASIGDAVLATDASGRITSMNRIAEELTGCAAAEGLGRPFAEVIRLLDPDRREPFADPVAEVLRGHCAGTLEGACVLVRPDGGERLVAASGAPIGEEGGAMLGVVLVLRDVTEQREIEEQLRQAQRMEAIGQLAGGVAHDFNNMLGGIMGAAGLLDRKLENQGEPRRLVGVVLDAAERAAVLTQELLTFSRKGQLEAEPIDLHACIHSAVTLLERSIDPRITIEVSSGAEHATVLGDRTRLEGALINLGVNARDAMPDGGTLTIETADATLDADFCEASPEPLEPGPYLEITVRDTGSGMSPEVRRRIFEPFFTTKEVGRGTGLGLAAVYGAVRSHAGAIRVESGPGEGTAFRLYLPVSPGLEVADDEGRPKTDLSIGQGLVLVVDDEAMVRDLLASMLETLGYEVLTARDGRAGVDLFRERWREIDLVLLDLRMPRLSGRDAFAEMRAIDPDVRVVFSSGYSPDVPLAELRADGALDFLQKPYTIEVLSRVIARHLRPSRAGS